jgi:hypothetical protein
MKKDFATSELLEMLGIDVNPNLQQKFMGMKTSNLVNCGDCSGER